MTKVTKFGKNLYAPLISPWYLNALGLPAICEYEKIGLPRGQISLSGKGGSQFRTKNPPERPDPRFRTEFQNLPEVVVDSDRFGSFPRGQGARLWDTTFWGDVRVLLQESLHSSIEEKIWIKSFGKTYQKVAQSLFSK